MMTRTNRNLLLLAGLLMVYAVYFGGPAWAELRLAVKRAFVSPPTPSVIFIVLDNVRADRLSLCGHDRPTSPTLDALAAEGATYSCAVTSPGAWTLPSHASYFTGRDPTQHGAHYVGGSGGPVRPMSADEHTLAERFAERGRQTLCVSANPVVGPETKATQGCAQLVVTPRFPDLLDDDLIEALRGELLKLDGDAPLFLFLNIADAHRPWRGVPADLGWIPRRRSLNLNTGDRRVGRYLRGEMSPEEAQDYLSALDDVYTYGVHRADDTLGRALALLERSGWLGADTRLVITSDHGEFLGEHGLLGHGRHVWEEDVRVPALIRGPEAPETLPAPMSGIDLFHYLDTGAFEAPEPVRVAAWPNPFGTVTRSRGDPGTQTAAALREGPIKWLWVDGEVQRFDLDADPQEQAGQPVEAPPALQAWVEAVQSSSASDAELDPETLEALRAAGYID